MKINEKVIKGLAALNISRNELEIILNVLEKLYDESSLESIGRKVKFIELANYLNY